MQRNQNGAEKAFISIMKSLRERLLLLLFGAPQYVGYSIGSSRQHYLIYREGDRSLTVFAEVASLGASRYITTSRMTHWDSPHQTENLSAEKRLQIINRIVVFCNDRGVKPILEGELDW